MSVSKITFCRPGCVTDAVLAGRFGLTARALRGVATPTLAHLAGGVNPNVLEVAAGIALFAAGIPLFLEPPDLANSSHPTWRRSR